MNQGDIAQTFNAVSEFFSKILPIFGVILLIVLIMVFVEVIKFIKGLDGAVNSVSNTLANVEKSVEKLQAPLNTVESLSYTIDSVHVISKNAVKKSVSSITDNYAIIKDWVGTFFE